MSKPYDVIVIGAGSAGLGVSLFAAKVGLRTLLVDRSDRDIGGDCLNHGCVPSKALIHVSRLVHSANEAKAFGLAVHGGLDVGKVTRYLSEKQDIIRQHENADFLRRQGIDIVLGHAQFSSRASIVVNDIQYNARKFVLATGSRPRRLEVPGIELVTQYDNESIFDLNNIPNKLLVIGGGPIGIELGQAFSRLGSEVTVVHRGQNILPHDDVASAEVLYSRLCKEGIRFHLESAVEKFNSRNEAVVRTKGNQVIIETMDAVLVATGRIEQ